MRHQNTGRQLSRNSAHRAALMRNMAAALLRHETIRTTLPKAKELRRTVEPLITLAREDSVAKRRLAYARLRDHEIVAKLFSDLGPHFKSRPGGYTRILKFGFRPGDKAPMAVMQLVDREAQMTAVSDRRAAARKAKRDAEEARAAGADTEAKPAKEKKAKAEPAPKVEKKAAQDKKKPAKGAEKVAAKAKAAEGAKPGEAKPEKVRKTRAAKTTTKKNDK